MSSKESNERLSVPGDAAGHHHRGLGQAGLVGRGRRRGAGRSLRPGHRQELLDDYCQLAIYDQQSAGLDIHTDGEHRRGGWIEGITGKMAAWR